MRPVDQMKARQAQADRELELAVKLTKDELAGLSAEATATVSDLEQIDARALKEHAVTLKAAASSVESRIAALLAAARRRRTCF